MCVKVLAFGVLIKLLCILANGFDKVKFTNKPGYRMTSAVLNTLIVSNKIQCVRACKSSPMCTSVNFLVFGNTNECELNVESNSSIENVIEDDGSELLCK